MKPQLKQIKAYNPPLQNRSKMIRLDFNENTSNYNPCLEKVLAELSIEKISKYPEYSKLNKKIAKYSKVKENMVLPTNGCDEGLKLVFDTFVDAKEDVVIPKPSFSMFFIYAQTTGAQIKSPNYLRNGGFPTKNVLDSISNKTRLVIICSPNNPTGTTIKQSDLEEILKKTKNGTVLVDEVYFEFSKKSFVSLLKKYNNLVISRTFSKAFGLAGLRIGYLLSNAKNIQIMKSVYSPYAINTIAKETAIECLNNPKYMKNYVFQVNKNKAKFQKYLKEKKIDFIESKANFVLIDFKKSKQFIINALFNEKILVRNQPKGKIRITIGDKEKNELLLKKLDKVLSKPILIFDIDGVLIEVSKSYRKAIQETVKFFSGKKITNSEIQEIKNKESLNNDWEITKRILTKYNKIIPIKKVVKKFQEFYLGKNFNGFIKNEKLLINKNILKNLYKKYELAIFTGRPKKEAKFILDYFKIKEFFSTLICMEDYAKGKPNPEGLKKIISTSVFKKAIYFGDSVADLESAKNAKIESIGVMSNQKYSVETQVALKKAGAKAILNNINEIEGELR